MISQEKYKQQFERLENTFGNYPEAQKALIISLTQALGPVLFESICTSFIMNRKPNQKPTPADFEAIVKARKSQLAPVTNNQPKIEHKTCPHCLDTGAAVHTESEALGIEIFANCLCSKGQEQKDLGRKMQSVDEVSKTMPFPAKLFIPQADPETGKSTTQEKIEEWNGLLELSQNFWKDHTPF